MRNEKSKHAFTVYAEIEKQSERSISMDEETKR